MRTAQTIPTRLVTLARSVAYQGGSWNGMMATWRETAPKTITLQWFALQLLEYAFDLRDRRPDPVMAGEIVEKLRGNGGKSRAPKPMRTSVE